MALKKILGLRCLGNGHQIFEVVLEGKKNLFYTDSWCYACTVSLKLGSSDHIGTVRLSFNRLASMLLLT